MYRGVVVGSSIRVDVGSTEVGEGRGVCTGVALTVAVTIGSDVVDGKIVASTGVGGSEVPAWHANVSASSSARRHMVKIRRLRIWRPLPANR